MLSGWKAGCVVAVVESEKHLRKQKKNPRTATTKRRKKARQEREKNTRAHAHTHTEGSVVGELFFFLISEQSCFG